MSIFAIGSETWSTSSRSWRGWIPSRPHALFLSSTLIFLATISAEIMTSGIEDVVLVSNLGSWTSGSMVKTLENYFCKMLAFSLSLCLILILSSGRSKSGVTDSFDLSLLTWDQTDLGEMAALVATSFLNFLLALRISSFTLLRTFVYAVLQLSSFQLLIQALCKRLFLQIIFRISKLKGTLPFCFQNGSSNDEIGTYLSRSWWIFALKISHNSYTSAVLLAKKLCFQFESLRSVSIDR